MADAAHVGVREDGAASVIDLYLSVRNKLGVELCSVLGVDLHLQHSSVRACAGAESFHMINGDDRACS